MAAATIDGEVVEQFLQTCMKDGGKVQLLLRLAQIFRDKKTLQEDFLFRFRSSLEMQKAIAESEKNIDEAFKKKVYAFFLSKPGLSPATVQQSISASGGAAGADNTALGAAVKMVGAAGDALTSTLMNMFGTFGPPAVVSIAPVPVEPPAILEKKREQELRDQQLIGMALPLVYGMLHDYLLQEIKSDNLRKVIDFFLYVIKDLLCEGEGADHNVTRQSIAIGFLSSFFYNQEDLSTWKQKLLVSGSAEERVELSLVFYLLCRTPGVIRSSYFNDYTQPVVRWNIDQKIEECFSSVEDKQQSVVSLLKLDYSWLLLHYLLEEKHVIEKEYVEAYAEKFWCYKKYPADMKKEPLHVQIMYRLRGGVSQYRRFTDKFVDNAVGADFIRCLTDTMPSKSLTLDVDATSLSLEEGSSKAGSAGDAFGFKFGSV